MTSNTNSKVVKLPHINVNFTFISDSHLSAVPPGTRRRDDYATAILNKFEFVRELTEKIQGVCLHGGDFWHIKTPRSPANNLSIICRAIRCLSKFPTGCIYTTPGNHDLSHDSLGSLPHQPLGILMAAGVCHDLSVTSVIFENSDGSVRVQVEAFSYADESVTMARLLASGPRIPGCYRVGIVHSYGSPKSHSLWGIDTLGYDQLMDLDYDFLLWGHDHSREETITVGNVTHVRLGSLSRASLSTDEVDRPVSAAVISFTTEGIKYQERRIPVKPLELAFVTADHNLANVAKLDEITTFFSDMDQAVSGIESTDPRNIIQSLTAEDPALTQMIFELCEL
jgi:hypothetical protein